MSERFYVIRAWPCFTLALALMVIVASALGQGTIAYVRLSTPNPDPNYPWDFEGMRLLASVPQTYNLDFNGDGTAEYVIHAPGPFSTSGFAIHPQGQNSVWIEPTFDSSLAAALPSGVEVGSSLASPFTDWAGGNAVFSACVDIGCLGNYTGLDWAYCPLRFDLDGNTHYGWVRVGSPLGGNGGWIYDYAYDTRPDASIFTGVPEPGTWALALYGAAAWLSLRRRPVAVSKMIVLLGLTVCASSLAHGQPLVNFANVLPGGSNAPIYGVDPRFPFTQRRADPGSFAGALVAGSGYTAELWGGPLGSAEGDLTPVGATTFRTGESAGLLQSVQLPMPPVMVGERATFQVRVWENLGGAVSNWSQALSCNFAAYGSSALVSPPEELGADPLNLVGLTSFNLIAPKSLTNVVPDCVLGSRSTIAWFNGPLSESSLDLDRDGTPDVAFWAERGQCTADYPVSSCYTPFYVVPLGTNGVLVQSNELWIRPPGFSVGGAASNVAWSLSAQNLTRYWNSPRYGVDGWTAPLGKWSAGYLGVRFHAPDGMHYGWIHVELPSTPGMAGGPIITDWAYETRLGVAICTGAKPVVIPLAPLGIVRPGYIRLRWMSEVDVAYQVQVKVQVDEPVWTDLEITILATSTNSIVDIPVVGVHRFFRIVETE